MSAMISRDVAEFRRYAVYADNERITLVCDNLNTHTKGAFYEALPA